jgi:hypothetical protein
LLLHLRGDRGAPGVGDQDDIRLGGDEVDDACQGAPDSSERTVLEPPGIERDAETTHARAAASME